ncbi:UDP-N-acetylmuramoyl-tripeptide--D-alanyl-D-alanine ligase [endosymbiont of Euscepes postfasciatus]|uniref:UDP-N-acetylmuramoyl-tripeptide--D-alanyl-D- alanine ligase n=1 Tax=endosymbiont of Euscepes postfasciatus TaxID=650377 RepID=UPI000DC73E04|nr:UDP-N-acetylmuramoyl-tripeptide--D-alanyl-D-alanine ligase [endosymbiont of Euscepes postfasciatus]BBA84553.1 UDP-N-acetylmuramoyl-tripeptide--D-alanyl-D-alanine ligase [endosymbiont of Euscepes postfasciatus]
MIKSNLIEISKFINGKIKKYNKNLTVNNISINSKNINKNCIFLAFKGEKYNAHDFVYESFKNGAIAIIVEKIFFDINIPQIIVKNTNIAFFKIAKLNRIKSKSYFIVITGSCGKTTVKEMVSNIIKLSNINFTYTKYNNNNIIGVSLTIIDLKINDKFVIIELGMDKLGQIFKSVKIIKPNLIFINNVFLNHIKNLKFYENVIKSKGEIFYGSNNNTKIIINYNSNYWNEWKSYFININKVPIYFSLNNCKTDFYASKINLLKFKSIFNINIYNKKIKIKLKLPGLHNISNSIAASSIAFIIGIKIKYIIKGLNNFYNIKQRLYPIYLNKNKIIINDTYNSSINSSIESINILNRLKGYKLLIIGDMLELGKLNKRSHYFLSKVINSLNINYIISYGKYSKYITNNIKNGIHIKNIKSLINIINKNIEKHRKINVLFKSSRNVGLSNILNIFLKKQTIKNFLC